MCLIIRKLAGRSVPREFIEQVAASNSHGWGYAYLSPRGELASNKGMRLEEGLVAFAQIPLQQEAILHLRRATRGALKPEMAHPFRLAPNLLLFHNGTLPLTPGHPEMSDTWELARLLTSLLKGLPASRRSSFIRSEGFCTLLSNFVQGSMVVLMDPSGILSFGRDWHTLSEADFPNTEGLQVSNLYSWKAGGSLPVSSPCEEP